MKRLAIALMLAACSDDPQPASDTLVASETTPDTTVEDVATEVAEDVAPTGCPPESAAANACTSLDWIEVDPYPRRTDHHTTLVHTRGDKTWLYVVGGVTVDEEEHAFAEVRRAEILDFGLLGAWEDEADLPRPLGFHGQATDGEHVWLTAGLSEDQDGIHGVITCYHGTFDADGHLTFAATTAMPQEGRLHPSAVVAHARLVVIGGTNGQSPVDTVVLSDINADGTVGAWRSGPAMPSARSHHAAVTHEGRIYIFGGFDAVNEPIAALWRSTHDGDGEPTGWEVIGTMADPPWTHAATLYKDGVMLVGGGEGGPGEEEYVDRVRWARFTATGVSDFVDIASPLPRARSHVHQAPFHDGFVYSVGGRSARSFSSIQDVFIGFLKF